MKFNIRNLLLPLAVCCFATFLSVSCGVVGGVAESSEKQFVVKSRFLPSEGVGTGSEINYSEYSLEKGLVVCHYHFGDLFGSVQDISVIEIDPSRYSFHVKDHKGFKRTSEVAEEAGAVAAINGTFYDMKKGGSVCYLQIDGVVTDTTKGNDMKLRTNGAVVLRNGKLSVESWSQEKEEKFIIKPGRTTSVMATMPLLIKDGYAVQLPYYKGFSDKRHPRSLVFEKDGRICLMVIDGRSKGNAEGMTLDEVQRYLLSMDGGKGCRNAVNLDGGGSSTLWQKASSDTPQASGGNSSGAPEKSGYFDVNAGNTGVINHPSDNGKFDHKGERRVANSIIVLSK